MGDSECLNTVFRGCPWGLVKSILSDLFRIMDFRITQISLRSRFWRGDWGTTMPAPQPLHGS